jgi:hypothetical protein
MSILKTSKDYSKKKMAMKFSFVLLTRILAVKKPRRLYDDIFFTLRVDTS